MTWLIYNFKVSENMQPVAFNMHNGMIMLSAYSFDVRSTCAESNQTALTCR